jgi:hypothetical protein
MMMQKTGTLTQTRLPYRYNSRASCPNIPLLISDPFKDTAYADFEAETEINQHRVDLASATLLHYNFDVATTVRYIGGPHVAAHRDVAQILATIRDSVARKICLT